MIRVVYFHIHVSCRCIYLAEPKSHACTLFKKNFWKMQVVGCQPLLFKKMSPQSTGMNGEWANKKCLQQTVPNLIGTDFMGWCSEDWPNICRLSMKEWHDSLVICWDTERGESLDMLAIHCFIPKQRQEERSNWEWQLGIWDR